MKLTHYFSGVAVKTLSATEVDPLTSHGHEFQGVRVLQAFLGVPAARRVMAATYLWLTDDEAPVRLDSSASWYDSRWNQPRRAPEPRLYYPSEAEDVVFRAKAGDTLFVCLTSAETLMFLLCPTGSAIEQQLLWLFDLTLGEAFQPKLFEDQSAPEIGYAARYVLDLIEIEVPVQEEGWLERLVARFGNSFPTTATFSAFAREAVGDVDVWGAPDEALMRWLDIEERLFLTFERHLIEERLVEGFGIAGRVDVDGFIQFSLSVQNRRKSRAGYSLENHLADIFERRGIAFERGGQTEGKKKPDFLFPGSAAYHAEDYPSERLTLLGAKSSCKDRWRQVLSEGAKVPEKHLITLEPGISLAQTEEMRAEALQLILPQGLHGTYLPQQQDWLMDLRSFLAIVEQRAETHH